MAAKTSFTARLNGKIIKRVSSNHPYTHAVVVQYDEKNARDEAYGPDKLDRNAMQHFHECCEIAKRGRKHPKAKHMDDEYLANCKELARIGIEGFKTLRRKNHIAGFERRKADGEFDRPRVSSWVTSFADGEKRAERLRTQHRGLYKVVVIVPAENETSASVAQRFAKLPKSTQRGILSHVCENMITCKAWDQIAGLLAVHLTDDAELVLQLAGKPGKRRE